MQEKKEKKKYESPQIVFEKKIETLAAVCDSNWFGELPCMKGGCPQAGA